MTIARSYLFAPGNNEALLTKVFSAGADAVVLDLEDAVPEAEKDAARHLVAHALTEARLDESPPQRWVRINALDGPHWREDLSKVVGPSLDGIRVPKAEQQAALSELDSALCALENDCALPIGSIRVTCTLESALGVLNAFEIAASPRVDRLAFGAADFVADVGADAREDQSTLFARSQLVVVSRAAGIEAPVAPVYTLLDDDDGLERSTRSAASLGFFGRSCIHPRQLDAIHRVFTPADQEIEWAREVTAVLDGARRSGSGAVTLADGSFVDEAVARRARRVLEIAERIVRPSERSSEKPAGMAG